MPEYCNRPVISPRLSLGGCSHHRAAVVGLPEGLVTLMVHVTDSLVSCCQLQRPEGIRLGHVWYNYRTVGGCPLLPCGLTLNRNQHVASHRNCQLSIPSAGRRL